MSQKRDLLYRVSIFVYLFLVVVFASGDKSKILEQIRVQSSKQEYVKLNGFNILYYKDYLKMSDLNRSKHINDFVLIEGRVTKAHYTRYGGTKVVIDGVGCGFFNRYYENVKKYEANKKSMSSICVLPYFDKCVPVIEGIDNFY